MEEVLKAPGEIQNELKRKISEVNLKILEETEECIELADYYIKDNAVPQKYRNDARHIAIGVCYEIDFIVSWNYKHMVNINVRRLINSANIKMGYNSVEIISPEEAIDYGNLEI